MLKRLHLKDFTVFAGADFEFVQGLNVLVGTNGTGKSHVLKLGYAVESARFDISKQFTVDQLKEPLTSSVAWTGILHKLLPDIFLSGRIAPLIRWDSEGDAKVEADFGTDNEVAFELSSSPKEADRKIASVRATHASAKTDKVFRPIFIPAKEILTLSWILPGSEQLVFPIEKNYLDLLSQLRLLSFRKPESSQAIQSLTDILGGEVKEEDGKYFLVNVDGRRTTINLVAEGLRKFGTLQKLLANGSLTKNATLYWDEPEANLNPALLRKLAAILSGLARQGFQIILATHSMSLLKEFHILSRQKTDEPLPIRYFGLNAEAGQPTTVVARDDFKFLPDVVALEVELEQADDLEEIFAREARQFHADSN